MKNEKGKLVPTVFIVELKPPFAHDDTPEIREQKIRQLEEKGIRIRPLKLTTIQGTNQAHIVLTKFEVPKEIRAADTWPGKRFKKDRVEVTACNSPVESVDWHRLESHVDADLCQIPLNDQGHPLPKREIFGQNTGEVQTRRRRTGG